VGEAKKCYVGLLGFTLDCGHHFEENTPAYLQVSTAGLGLHQPEQDGDRLLPFRQHPHVAALFNLDVDDVRAAAHGQSSTYAWLAPADRSMGTTICSPQESQM
jgi:hypothetical protein